MIKVKYFAPPPWPCISSVFFFKQQNVGKTKFLVHDFQDNIKSAFGNLTEDNDSNFADVTLVYEDVHQVEAHKVILGGFSLQTTIHTHCSKLEDLTLHPIYFPTGAKRRWGEDTSVLHICDFSRDKKQGTKSCVSRGEINCSTKSWKSRGEREIVLQNLENREERKKLFCKTFKIERRKSFSL